MNRCTTLLTAALTAALSLAVTPPRHDARAAPLPASDAGTMEGTFEVNGNGAATYTLSFEVPPGTNGVQPDLSVVYDSQQPGGLLGVGFTLHGVPSITRCAANLAIDGYNAGVTLTDKDRYCLDGQRLIKVAGTGPYGAPGAVYHTEMETWTRVTAGPACGTAPCSFIAHNKDGWEIAFGASANSRVAIPGRDEMVAWQVATITDLHGNTVSVTYQADSQYHQNYPARITYTANEDTGLAASRTIEFDYELRPDAVPKYQGNVVFQTTRRLRAIRAEVSGQPGLSYTFYYETSPATGRSLLTAVQKCAGTSCISPTLFAWQRTANTVASPNSDASGTVVINWCTGSGYPPSWADFNGDGKGDLYCGDESGAQRVLLSTGSGVRSPNNRADGLLLDAYCAGAGAHAGWADFNGDRRADLTCSTDDGSQSVMLSTGTALMSPNSNPSGVVRTAWCPASSCSVTWANFTGTGRADLLCSCADGTQRALLSTGDGVKSPNSSPDGVINTGYCAGADKTSFWSDFNGDGLADLFCSGGDGLQQVLVSTGDDLVSPNSSPDGVIATSWCAASGDRVGTTNFNGDGFSDLYCSNANGTQKVLLSSGTRLVSPNSRADGTLITGWCNEPGAAVSWSDFNGDGLADLHCDDEAGVFSVMLSTGTGLASPNSSPSGIIRTSWCVGGSSAASSTRVDFNADALFDVHCGEADGSQSVLVHDPSFPDLVTAVTNSVRGTVEITYAALSDSSVYRRGGEESYPLLDVESPLYVVARYLTGDGRGDSYAYSYVYSGARTDLYRQRWLGFHSVEMTSEATGERSVVTYGQDYPVIGFAVASAVYDRLGSLLSSSEITPTVLTPYANVNQVLRSGEVTINYTGGQPSTLSKEYEYDAYGNVSLESDLGDPVTTEDDVFTCFKYVNDIESWRLGYQKGSKITKTEAGCRAYLDAPGAVSWDAAVDLRWTEVEFSEAMDRQAISAWDDVNDGWSTIRRGYDAVGNIQEIIDQAGNVTTIDYEATYQSFPVTQTSPALPYGPLVTTFEYDPVFGALIRQVDANGNALRHELDPFGRIVKTTGPAPVAGSGAATTVLRTYSYAFDATAYYTEERARWDWSDDDPANWFWSRTYADGLGRTIRQAKRGPETGKEVYRDVAYDSRGQPHKTSYPYYAGDPVHWIVQDFDDYNRPTTLTYPDGTVFENSYQAGGRQLTIVVAKGTPAERTTVNAIDSRGMVTKSTMANGAETTFDYDKLSQQRRITGPNGNVTKIDRDSLGRVIRTESADAGVRVYRYDLEGRLTQSVDGVGNTVDYAYDALNRVITHTVNKGKPDEFVRTFRYDEPEYTNGRGKLTSVSDPAAAHAFSYDNYDNVAIEKLTLDGVDYIQKTTFNAVDEQTSLTYPDGAVLSIGYDDEGYLQSIELQAEEGASSVPYATFGPYTVLGEPTTLAYRNGLTQSWDYYTIPEQLGRLKRWTVAPTPPGSQAATQPLQSASYQWTRASQVKEIDSVQGDAPVVKRVLGYSVMGWLESAQEPQGSLSYQYDLAGNFLDKDGVSYEYETGTNRLIAGDNGLSVSYDGNGNVATKSLSGDTWTYTYDPEDNLAAVTHNGQGVMSAVYDYYGNRLERTDAAGNVSLYVSADYGVLERGGTVLHTKYIHGHRGPIAAITTDRTGDAAFAPVIRNGLRLEGEMYDRGSAAGLGALAKNHLARLAVHVSARAWLVLVLSLAVIAAACGLWRRRLFALPRSSLGRTEFAMRHPVHGATAVLTAAIFLATYLPPVTARAELSGDGYPEPGTLYFHHNQVESVILVTDEQGADKTAVDYQPFGSIDEAASQGANVFRPKYTGKELDDGSALYYFGSRYYDAHLGRFIEPDPARQYASPYTYVGNDPESQIDASGDLATLVVLIIVGAVVGATAGAYFGGQAVNHDYNPAHWDWRSGKTFGGIFAGALIGAVGGAIGGASAEAGVAAGIAGEVLVGAGENAAFAALGGGSPKEIAISALTGAAGGAVFGAAGAGLNRVGSRLASRFARRGGAVAELGEQPAQTARALANACGSFPAGEKVATAEGLRSIENVGLDDMVYGVAAAGAEAELYPVAMLVTRMAASLVEIRLEGNAGGEPAVLRVTPEHPFWLGEKGWIESRYLVAGDVLASRDGMGRTVSAITEVSGPIQVFNLVVGESHTYFASDAGVLVHNPRLTRCLLSKLPATRSMTTARQKALWRAKIRKLIAEYGDESVSYHDPSSGRRYLDLESYAMRWQGTGKRAIIDLRTMGKGSTRSQHFRYADRAYGGIVKAKFKRSGYYRGQFRKPLKWTWHHHPNVKSVAFVPRGLHSKLGHQGSFAHLF